MHINRAFKCTSESGESEYEIGASKTKRSVGTLNVSRSLLDTLDYEGEWLFTNTKGGPLKGVGWRTNVWYPSTGAGPRRSTKEANANSRRIDLCCFALRRVGRAGQKGARCEGENLCSWRKRRARCALARSMMRLFACGRPKCRINVARR